MSKKDETYDRGRAAAQLYADTYQRDVGLEWNEVFEEWVHFALPRPENRFGHERRCEVVRPTGPW